MSEITAKTKILNAASVLFYNYGISNTGINLITDRAKVAKMSLYNNYSTKSDLIKDYIKLNIDDWLKRYRQKEQIISSPIEGVIAIFDTYIDYSSAVYEKGYRGCSLLNAATEFELNSEELLYIRNHKENIRKIIEKHLLNIFHNNEKVRSLSSLISYILEGAVIKAGLDGKSDKLFEAKSLALGVIVGNY
ncbi:TetR/AcrR family transcriptional regulator [Acinetobacter seifertii]|uniref:TetR/AcrR family transcriptional regulator n=1 Tax=Acinetobacter seifertii TaxID=1530123 RepID=UPI00124F2078|nr:TetR family transcriptional regulator [Acinetobacter seifertii]